MYDLFENSRIDDNLMDALFHNKMSNTLSIM